MNAFLTGGPGGALGAALLLAAFAGLAIPGCPLRDPGDAEPVAPGGRVEAPPGGPGSNPACDASGGIVRIERSDAEWRRRLTPEQYRVTREGGTEPPFRNAFFDHAEAGTYLCVGCDLPLFDSGAKFESCAGWPSFRMPVDRRHVSEVVDRSHGMTRTEAVCARCDAHLGHVFEDGPAPGGRRY